MHSLTIAPQLKLTNLTAYLYKGRLNRNINTLNMV
jgi:hypothetical protein